MHSLKAATCHFGLVFGTGFVLGDPVSGTVYLLALGLFALMPAILARMLARPKL